MKVNMLCIKYGDNAYENCLFANCVYRGVVCKHLRIYNKGD